MKGHLATAALLNSTLMSNYFVDKMTSTIENDKKLTHEKVRFFQCSCLE